jgi:hypothetical protein
MHALSITENIIAIAERHTRAAQATCIISIRLVIGEPSVDAKYEGPERGLGALPRLYGAFGISYNERIAVACGSVVASLL